MALTIKDRQDILKDKRTLEGKRKVEVWVYPENALVLRALARALDFHTDGVVIYRKKQKLKDHDTLVVRCQNEDKQLDVRSDQDLFD